MTTPTPEQDRELADTFTGCLASAIRQADRLVASVFDERLRAVGLRGTQMSLLGMIAKLGRPSQSELAEATYTDATTLSRNLDRLVERGLAERTECDQDKRVRRYSLTDDGRSLLVDALPHWRAAQQEVSDRLGGDACELLRQLTASLANS